MRFIKLTYLLSLFFTCIFLSTCQHAPKERTVEEIDFVIDNTEFDTVEQDSLRIIEIQNKKNDGDKLRAKEQKDLTLYEYELRQENVTHQLEQLEQQHNKIDSLLEKKNK